MHEYNTRDYPRGYVPKVQYGGYSPTYGDTVYDRNSPSALRWDIVLHDSGCMFLRCLACTGYVISAWYINLDHAAALENGATVYLTGADLVVRTLTRYIVFADLTHVPNINQLVLTHYLVR